ncbi:lytic transglycosylase domain-containing protein, partial [Neisseria sp. P0024.S006]|uniref:lytic transglycosylase domain-containing protein n=1 Tax=Neisseria sp. P0024.S006 TaxID=3436850 RepID=UPI003F7EFACE
TDHKLNYKLRYISPFKDLTVRYASHAGIDPAWVSNLIRQESRFVLGAQSSVGAQGLMQVMPATAREIAGKIGLSSSELYTMDGNVRMGTWYMADTKRRLQNNELMATAGYNADTGRARNWQASSPLEGAIYTETTHFTAHRDYVHKIMHNATYY